MSDEERIAEAHRRYMAAMTGVQSAIRFELECGSQQATPKHLRVGINSALVNDHAIAELLMSKGIITKLEYHEQVAKSAEEELARFHAAHKGITFG